MSIVQLSSSTNPTDLTEDDPRQSSAARCIQLKLLQFTFSPDYTHQCFDNEVIRGYQPAHPGGLKHSSYRYHADSDRLLTITVQLAPSGRKCAVQVTTTRKRQILLRTRTAPPSKKSKANGVDAARSGEDSDSSSCSSAYEETDQCSESEHDSNKEGTTRKARMPVEEIHERLAKALPKMVINGDDDENDVVGQDYLDRPIGRTLHEYACNDMEFILTIATGQEAADYHDHVQKLSLFFIESGEAVNVRNNRDGGFWRILYLFRRHDAGKQQCRFSFVGFMTLFFFNAVFHKPKPGHIMRVCQVLILPPYQRAGHGEKMLKNVYQLNHEDLDENIIPSDIVEINVEDPAPAFTQLRNKVDYGQYRASVQSGIDWFQPENDEKISNFESLADARAIEVGTHAIITRHQATIVFELEKLRQLRTLLKCSNSTTDKEAIEKPFRLLIKRRLNKTHREEMAAYETKDQKRAFLDQKYNETIAGYNKILDSFNP